MSKLDVSIDKMNISDDNITVETTANKDNELSVCANCGKGGSDLKNCTACKMVKYCNRECQIAHRPQHKKECRKRAAEIHDIELFKQPPSLHDDCPICFLRLPFLYTGRRYMTCCGKEICSGCIRAPLYDHKGNEIDNQKCAFCRAPHPTGDEFLEREEKRKDLDDPIAIYNQGMYYKDGANGYPQDYTKALEFYHRAVELGYIEAYNGIGHAYDNGRGVEFDQKKAMHYYELAAMKGSIKSRGTLGIKEELAGNVDRAIKHYMIAVRGGEGQTLEYIKEIYMRGQATKEEYTKALQAYQEYLGEIKSVQRDKAAAAREGYRYY